jgi:glycosyltransferase involved in cell wall biosynthesis
MKLAVISHKLCWKMPGTVEDYRTDGGFPLQIEAISELFDETRLVVPCETASDKQGLSPLVGHRLSVAPLSVPKGTDLRRKLDIPFWLARNGRRIWGEIRRADAVHAPIPGDVGTIGFLFALVQRKPLFVRHCGNWMVQKTAAEAFWRWMMVRFAGGRNVMLATGGSEEAPSRKNPQIRWIFSTSLSHREIREAAPRQFPSNRELKLLVACRLEKNKGVETVIESLPRIVEKFPRATLEIVGGGSLLKELQMRAKILKVDDRIKFYGKIEQKRVLQIMRGAHVFCFPTRASEGFPKVVIEALACGLPVITTRVSVLPHLIDEKCGILLNEASPENLARAVSEICAKPENYEALSVNAIAAAQAFTLENWRGAIGETLKKSWGVESLAN